ncbi:MAG TPA: Ig-like domain-containing protein, partial [Gemmatimonadales bacterium]|nr:Ig-like domain-containing protein [Gemmatimonadales bacterium]
MPFTFKLSQRLARIRSRAVIVTLAALAGCEKPIAVATDPGGAPASQIIVSPRAVTLHTNQTVDLTAVGLTAIGDTATVAVTWSMTTGSVIDTSTSGGKHYGRYKAGSDTGTAKVIVHGHPGTTTDTSVVTVTAAPVAAVTLSPSSASLLVGQTTQLGATTTDSAGNVLSGRTVTWTSSNPAVTTVNGTGLASAVSVGSATITATSEGQGGTAAISVSNVPVATVRVSPASASVLAGQTVQLAATTRDGSGNVLTGRSIVWTTSNGSVATVSGSGLVIGVTAGSATITATSEGQSGSAATTVTNPPVSPPGTVTDLAISAVTDSSVTISFTEVTDGTGSPASYDVRYAVGTISWGSGTEVSHGTCTTPVAGSSVGANRTCTILGLNQSTGYGVQLVAFRGTLGVNAVFGSLSNVASGTTAAGARAPVASVTVSPASASVGVGGTQQYTATLKDASGNVLTGRTITWTSSALGVATISGSGLVTTLVAGTSTITATSEGQSGSAALTVTALPPPSGSWPNEPSGLSVWSDYGFGTAIPVTSSDVPLTDGSGWSSIYNGNGLGSIGSD